MNLRLKYLTLALSSIFIMTGCSSVSKIEKKDEDVKKEIINSFNVSPEMSFKISDNKNMIIEEIVEPKKESKFNLMVNKAPVGAVLQSLVDGTNYSLITPEDLTGLITLNLKNVSAFEVLETLKNVYHYDYDVQDKRIIVYPNGIRTKIFVINHLIGKRQGNSELKVSSGSLTDNPTVNDVNTSTNGTTNSGLGNTATPSSTKVSTSTDSNFWGEIGKTIGMLVGKKSSDEISVIVNQETNTIIVRGTPAEINEVEKYLKKIQVIIDKQVIIEAKLIEVQLSNSMQSGINWAAFGSGSDGRASIGFSQANSSLGTSGNLALTGSNAISSNPGSSLVNGALAGNSIFSMAFQTNNFASILNFLETQGSLQVLSSPRIATLNNQKAILKVGTDEFFITNVTTTSTSSSGGTTNSPSVTTRPFFSGIALDITPQISDNGLVTMHVHPSVSQVSTVTKNINLGTMGNIVLPLASSTISETDSIVKIESNKIVAIGGLMKQYSKKNKSQVPGVADAPIVGEAFKNTDDDFVKYELVILLKPQIINSSSDWEVNLNEIRKRLIDFSPSNETIIVDKKD